MLLKPPEEAENSKDPKVRVGKSRKKGSAWRIIPVGKCLVTPIYKPYRPFIRGTTPVREDWGSP